MDKQLTFSFDFDNNISKDPLTFLGIMQFIQDMGHKAIVCTCRLPTTEPEDLDFLVKRGYEVIFTSHVGKKKYLRSIGIEVDIWIDDCAESILEDWNGAARTFREMENGYECVA